MTNADLLGLRMAWPVYSVPLTVVGCIAVVVGVAVVIFPTQGWCTCRLAIGATESLVGGGGLFYAVAVHLGLAIGRQTGVANFVEQGAVADAQRPCRLLTVPMVGLEDL